MDDGYGAVGNSFPDGGVSPQSNTGAPSGNVTIVTPIFISTNIGASAILPAFGILNLHFVPEPGTLMLLGSGIAGLVAFGRSRVRLAASFELTVCSRGRSSARMTAPF